MNKFAELKLVHDAGHRTAYTKENSIDILIEYVKTELSQFSDLLYVSRVSLRVAKSLNSLYSNKKVHTAFFNLIRGRNLLQSNEIKFLGV